MSESTMTIYDFANTNSPIPYSTVDATTVEGAELLFKAMNRADEGMKSMANQMIEVTGAFVQRIQRPDDETGELRDLVKLVLFDKDGKTYGTTSRPFYEAFVNLCLIVGEPKAWKSPVAITVKLVKVANGEMLTFEPEFEQDNLRLSSPTE